MIDTGYKLVVVFALITTVVLELISVVQREDDNELQISNGKLISWWYSQI